LLHRRLRVLLLLRGVGHHLLVLVLVLVLLAVLLVRRLRGAVLVAERAERAVDLHGRHLAAHVAVPLRRCVHDLAAQVGE
jgi:hypothetical protein